MGGSAASSLAALRLITVGGRSAHLAYHVHKSGRNISKHQPASWPYFDIK